MNAQGGLQQKKRGYNVQAIPKTIPNKCSPAKNAKKKFSIKPATPATQLAIFAILTATEIESRRAHRNQPRMMAHIPATATVNKAKPLHASRTLAQGPPMAVTPATGSTTSGVMHSAALLRTSAGE